MAQHNDSNHDHRKKSAFLQTLPFMTKQRCCSAAATSRLHRKFGIIDTSVATSDILTDVMFSDDFLMSDILSTNVMLTGLLFLFSTFLLISGRK